MKFIYSDDAKGGISDMAEKISSSLNNKKAVLWLICGGSNIPFAVEAMKQVRQDVPLINLGYLTVAETDERYGSIGHPDSNWKNLADAGFDLVGIKTFSILQGKPLEETAKDYATSMSELFDNTIHSGGYVIAQFGIGTNSHIAGIYPNSVSVESKDFVSGYDSGDFIRVTLNPKALRRISCAYVFAFGSSKEAPLVSLRDRDLPITEAPSQILKELPEVYIYSDQI